MNHTFATPATSKEPLVILASARKNSVTHALVSQLLGNRKYKAINLLDYQIAPYCYTGKYGATDEFSVLTQLMLQHDTIILATPVYWYSMSGLLKNFMDRFTDLITLHKTAGRQMAGKQVFVVATGSDLKLPTGFEEPFRLTALYFKMKYGGCFYCPCAQVAELSLPNAATFVEQVYINSLTS